MHESKSYPALSEIKPIISESQAPAHAWPTSRSIMACPNYERRNWLARKRAIIEISLVKCSRALIARLRGILRSDNASINGQWSRKYRPKVINILHQRIKLPLGGGENNILEAYICKACEGAVCFAAMQHVLARRALRYQRRRSWNHQIMCSGRNNLI